MVNVLILSSAYNNILTVDTTTAMDTLIASTAMHANGSQYAIWRFKEEYKILVSSSNRYLNYIDRNMPNYYVSCKIL